MILRLSSIVLVVSDQSYLYIYVSEQQSPMRRGIPDVIK